MTDAPQNPVPGYYPDGNGHPKADAKAAKAYAKATRPWYKKKRWIAAIILVIAVIAAAAGSGGGSDDAADTSSDTSSSAEDSKGDSAGNSGAESDAEPSAFGSSKLPLQNGDWRLDSIKVRDDGLGGFGADARITYTGDDEDGGTNLFTVTLFKGKEAVGTLNGSANTVLPGRTVTVQFFSVNDDDFQDGPYKYDFQNDL